MCYSAQVSFIVSGYLLLAGLWSLKRNKRSDLRLFATMPLIFAAQQACEGIIWLGYTSGSIFQLVPYMYLFFAFVVWPLFIPISILRMEPKASIKSVLYKFAYLGAAVSCILYAYVIAGGVSAQPLSCHIYYNWNIPDTARNILTLLYLFVTVMPFLVSSIRSMPFFGLLVLGSYFIAYYFYYMHILSIWCFFAALLSCLVCIIVYERNKKPSEK